MGSAGAHTFHSFMLRAVQEWARYASTFCNIRPIRIEPGGPVAVGRPADGDLPCPPAIPILKTGGSSCQAMRSEGRGNEGMAQTKKPEIYEKIITAAREEFEARGYVETTVTDIARRAQVTPSNIYKYYSSKLALFYEVFGPYISGQLDLLQRRVRAEKDPRRQMPCS